MFIGYTVENCTMAIFHLPLIDFLGTHENAESGSRSDSSQGVEENLAAVGEFSRINSEMLLLFHR